MIIALIFGLLQACRTDVLVEAHTRPTVEDIDLQNLEEFDDNEIIVPRLKTDVDELHYYLPTQAASYGRRASTLRASLTLPPLISPSTIQASYEQVTQTLVDNDSEWKDAYITPIMSHCVSETPSNVKIQSEKILTSKDFVLKSLVLSGHSEIPGKTHSDSNNPEVSKGISESSVPLQGSHIYMPSTTDM